MSTALLTILAVKQRNAANGGCWFEPGAMRFFHTRVSEQVYPTARGTFFVTSERGPDEVRRFSVRFAAITDGSVETVGEFQAYRTSRAAHTAARRAARTS